MHFVLLFCVLGASRAVFVSPKLPSNHSPARGTPKAELRVYQIADHEEPETRRPYSLPGDWATPAPESGIDVGFTPVQTYIAVRRSNTVQRLPRSEAYKEATSPDELRNSHRLREVLRTKKIQEVYSEEGYEDSAYDHGTRERVAEYDEDYEKGNKGKKRGSKKYAPKGDDSDDAESRPTEVTSRKGPKTSRKKVETNKVEFAYVEPEDKPEKRKRKKGIRSKDANKEDGFMSRNYREYSANGDFVDFPHITFEDWKPRSKKFDGFSKGHLGKSNQQVEDPAMYIHSLTDAHYGHQPPVPARQPKAIPSKLIGMTKGFAEAPDFTSFEPRKVRSRVRRDAESSQFEKELAKALDQHEKALIGKVLESVESAPVEKDEWRPIFPPQKPKASWIDTFKYPYYHLKNIDPFSPLKYASNSQLFPKKSGKGMEFYDSRDRAVQCDEINVSVENSSGTQVPTNKKRIVGLGDKIQCMKKKYFGEDPLDSPFFKEGSSSQQSTTPSHPPVAEDKIMPQVNDSTVEGSQPEVNYEVFHPVTDSPVENVKSHGRVIPVKEFYPEITTPTAIHGMQPPVSYRFQPLSVISIPRIPKPKPLKQMKKVTSNYNCLQPVTRMIVTERSDEDVMYDCPDVTLIQTVRAGNQHFKIIPKKYIKSRSGDGPTVRLLRAGEVIEAQHLRHKRSDDLNARRRSQLFPNRSLLDKMVNRSPSRRANATTSGTNTVISTLRPSTSVRTPSAPRTDRNRAPVSTPRPPRPTPASAQSKPTTTTVSPNKKVMPKKQTGKLSGLDFLTRYHKAKNANRDGAKGVEFFRAESSSDMVKAGTQNIRKRWVTSADMSDPMLTGSSYLRRSDVLESRMRRSWAEPSPKAPVLLYVVNVDTGVGKWISEPTILPEVKWMSQRYLPILELKN